MPDPCQIDLTDELIPKIPLSAMYHFFMQDVRILEGCGALLPAYLTDELEFLLCGLHALVQVVLAGELFPTSVELEALHPVTFRCVAVPVGLDENHMSCRPRV